MFKKVLKTACSLFLAASACICASAAFEKTTTYAEGTFKDIPSTAWYAKEVKNTYELGLMQGTSDTAFAPEDNVTLAQAITVASRVCAIYNDEEIPAAEGAWYKMYVDYAAKKGFWKTSEDDTTDYNRPATRLEVASLFADALPDSYYTVKNDVTLIPDMLGVTEGYDKILKLYRAGVVLGNDDIGSFFPNKNIKRAEMSAIINRVALPENRLEGSFELKKSNDDAYLFATHTNYNGNKNNSQMVSAIASGWRLDNRGGERRTEYSLGYEKISDISKTEGVAFIREFNRTETGYVVLETTLDTDGNDGLYMEYRNEADEAIYHVEVKDGIWQHKNADGTFTPIYAAGKLERHFDFRIEIDLDNKYSKTYINKNCVGVFKLISDDVNIFNFRFAFTEEGTGVAYPGYFRSYVNYPVYEDFMFGKNATLPILWNGEKAELSKNQDFVIKDGGKAERKFVSTSGNIAFDYNFFQKAGDVLKATVVGDGVKAFEITNDDKNIYVNGKVLYADYVKNMWYRIRAEFDTTTHKALFKVNGRKMLELDLDKALASVDTLTFEAKGANGIILDDVKLRNLVEHEDYVPEPKPIANDDDYTVGMNVCSLWVTGDFHKSWASVSAYPDKKPVLGYYDEGIIETADWEIKFLLEHGVDFQMFCWYPNSTTEPLKPAHASHLHDAFMNAKYSYMTKYAIIWEASGTNPANVANFKSYYAPYIIENYFKDKDRYMTIDNKPVMVIFSVETLIKSLGSKEKFNECMDYLEEEAKKLGYDGMLLLTTGYTPLVMSDTRVDGAFPYSWSVSGYMPEINKLRMTENQRKSDIYNIPTISVGFNKIGWYPDRYPLMTKEGFTDVAQWIKDEYLPENAKEDWQKNLVMLSTWNEYGEGTYIMPAEGNVGFGYLDALKTTLYGESEDTCDDIVPTENQKKRINRIYPQYRNLLTHEGYYQISYDDSNSKNLYKIDYTNESNFEKPYKTENVVCDENGVSGTCIGDTSVTHNVKKGEEIELSDVSLVKICGTFPASDRIDMFYLTEGETTFYAKKGLGFIANEAGTYGEYYIDVSGKGAIWTGKLTRFRIDPATVDGTKFTLKSIEFLSASSNKTMYIDGTEVNMQFPPINEGDVVTVGFEPGKAMDFLLDAFHEWNKADGELTLYFEKNTVKFKIGSDKYWLNGEEKALGFTLKSLDGLPYVPIKLICDIQGYAYSEDENGKISIDTKYEKPEYQMAERKELNEFYGGEWYEQNDAPEGYKTITYHTNNDNPEYPYEFARALPKNNNSVYLYVFHDYTFVPGKTYRVVGDVRIVSNGLQIPAPLSVSSYVTFNMRYDDYKGVDHIVKRYNLSYKEEWQPVAFEFTVPEYSATRDNDCFSIYTDPRNGMGVGYDFRNLCISDANDPTNEEYEKALAERRKLESDKSTWDLKALSVDATAGTAAFEVDTEAAALLGENEPKPTFYKAVPSDTNTGLFYTTHPFTFIPGTKYTFTADYKVLPQGDTDIRAAVSFNMMYTDKESKNHVVYVHRQSSADGWQKITFDFFVPEDCVDRSQDRFGMFTNAVNGKAVGYCLRNANISKAEIKPEDLIPDNIGGDLYDFTISSGVGKKAIDPDNAENYCYLVMPTSDEPVYLYTSVPYTFEAGATYKVDIDLKVASKGIDMETADNEFLTKIVFNMQYADPAGKNHVVLRQPIKISDGWMHVSFEFTVSADSDARNSDKFTFYADPNVGISAGYYIDNLTVAKIS